MNINEHYEYLFKMFKHWKKHSSKRKKIGGCDQITMKNYRRLNSEHYTN